MFVVEKKRIKDKRYSKIVYFSENIKECENFIINEIKKSKKNVYRIRDIETELTSKPISFSNKLLENDI